MHKDTKKKYDAGAYCNMPIHLGQVDFVNCLPVNLPIETGKIKINAEITRGLPSELNSQILKDEIDIAPVSSLAYIENKDKLIPVANLCIASNGPADSVLLFSQFPLEELSGARVALTYASATSNKLLELIFKKFINVNVQFTIKNLRLEELSKDYPACLFIGDHALVEFSKKPTNLFIYDLGSLWRKYTNLPMVFGLWVARKELYETYPEEVYAIANGLQKAKELGLGEMIDQVIKKSQEKVLISKEFYDSYFKHLSYEFTKECEDGLKLFEDFCLNLNKKTVAGVIGD